MLSEIEKLKEELRKEFFLDDKKSNNSGNKSGNNSRNKSNRNSENFENSGDNPKVEIIKKTLSDEVASEGITMDIVNTIFMHRHQPRRFEQLRKINESRSMYQDTYYAEQFEMLDNHIEEIEEEIFMCTKVAIMAFKYGVKGIVMAAWCKGSIHIERIRLAYELSAEYRMDLASDVLEAGIKDPNLQIQYTGLIRELALHHSRMAGFQNQKKFGKRPDIEIGIRPIQQITDQQMDRLIETFREDRKKIREISEGFDSYVEIKDEQSNLPVVQQNSGIDKPVEYNSIDDIIAKSKLSKQKAEEDDGVFDLDKIQ